MFSISCGDAYTPQRILKWFSFSIQANTARSRISYQKAHGVSPDELGARVSAQNTKLVEQQELVTIYRAYESALATSNLLDYDDLLLRCADLLRQHPECVSNVQAVLVDEFQDTNHIQYELMNLFASRNRRITVVGDPDQSIYGFRSAEIKNLSRMQRLYRDTSVVLLEDNYRSSGSILKSAQDVIDQDVSRPAKKLQPTHSIGTMPVLRKLPTAEAEALWLVLEIKRSIAMTGNLLNYSDFAILLRSASLSRHIESAMGKTGVPYKMVGGSRFFDRVEIKLLLDYLRVVSHAENSDALLRILNVPSRRIGEESIKLLTSGAEKANVPLCNYINDVAQGNKSTAKSLSTAADQGISAFVGLIQSGKQKLLECKDCSAPRKLLDFFINKLSFQEYLKKMYPQDEQNRWANVDELLCQAEDTATGAEPEQDDRLPEVDGLEQQQTHAGEDALARFLANVALSSEVTSQEDEKQREKVTISTIHAAKGLEWPVVFVPAVYEGSIPHSRAEDSDEERRLLYVAMTRAQALLYLSFPLECRTGMETKQTSPTSFLPESMTATRFRPTGPKLVDEVVFGIADILRRSRPSPTAMLKGLDDIPSALDNRWTADGHEPPNAVTRWDGTVTAQQEGQPNPKRRRYDHIQSTTTTYMSAPGYTMSNGSNFSVPSSASTGFSTAREYIQTNQRSQSDEPKPDEMQKSSTENKTKNGLAQRDIANFFGKPPSKAQPSTHTQSPQLRHTSCQSSTSQTSTSSISKLSTYRPQTQPRFNRPTLEPSDPNKYTWLSAPSKPSDKPTPQKTQRDNQPSSNTHGSGPAQTENIPSASAASDIRQSNTYHTTTMSMLQNPASSGRKTLGIRRTPGNGWEARMNRERNGNLR